MEIGYGDYLISDDKTRLQLEIIHQLLVRTYWASERSAETVARSIENSRCYGVYDREGRQVAFARVITDSATMYYLSDVVVDESLRGTGVGKRLVEAIVSSEEYRGLTGNLVTADAHALYEKFGFERMPDSFMRKWPETQEDRWRA